MPTLAHIRTKADFQRAFRVGGRAYQDGLQLRFVRTDQPSRLGVVIRASALKRATRRNRVRRLIQESIRELASAIPPGFDLVVVPSGEPRIDHRDYIRAALARALQKAGALEGPLPPWPATLPINKRWTPPEPGASSARHRRPTGQRP